MKPRLGNPRGSGEPQVHRVRLWLTLGLVLGLMVALLLRPMWGLTLPVLLGPMLQAQEERQGLGRERTGVSW